MKKENTLPAINDHSFREQQLNKMVDGLHEMGAYAKSMRKSQKISLWFGIASVFLIFAIIGAAFIAGGGLEGVIDLRASKRSFDCVGDKKQYCEGKLCINTNAPTDRVRSYQDAADFIELYGGTCTLHIKGEQ